MVLAGILTVALVGVVFCTPAYAYLDPGTGSMIFQIVVGVALGAAFTVKMWWGRLKGMLFRKKDKDGV